MSIKNLYINDLVHRYPSHTFEETTTGSLINVKFKNASSIVVGEATKLVTVDAYRAIRGNLLIGEVPVYRSTTTQRDALTGIPASTEIDNITVGRNEIWDGTNWKPLNRRSIGSSLTASTTQTQGNGLLSKDLNIITTVANPRDTVTLPTAVAGDIVVIVNKGSNKMRIYPNTGDNLGEGVNSRITLAAGSSITFYCYDVTNWVST